MELGTLRELSNGYELRFERWMAHAPAKVWRALTENDALREWFPAMIDGEWMVGSKLHFRFGDVHDENMPDDVKAMDESQFWGEVLEVDEPHRLSYTWNQDRLTFELSEDDGGCRLLFTTLQTNRDHLCRTAAGWHECVDMLAARESDQPWTLAHTERWAQVHPLYEQAFGPDPRPHVKKD